MLDKMHFSNKNFEATPDTEKSWKGSICTECNTPIREGNKYKAGWFFGAPKRVLDGKGCLYHKTCTGPKANCEACQVMKRKLGHGCWMHNRANFKNHKEKPYKPPPPHPPRPPLPPPFIPKSARASPGHRRSRSS